MFFDEYHPEGDDSLVPTHLRTSFFNSCDESTAFGVDMSRLLRYAPSDRIHTEDYQKNISGFFRKEPCLYTHRNFRFAGSIFAVMKQETKMNNYHRRLAMRALLGMKMKANFDQGISSNVEVPTKMIDGDDSLLPPMDFRSANEKRLSFMLVFETLKYQIFLQEILDESQFFDNFPEHIEDAHEVMVILCDFKIRNFQKRQVQPDEELMDRISLIEDAIYRYKTKLNAALARCRIRLRVQSLDYLLPDTVRQNEKLGSKMHVCCWINQIKISISSMIERLEADGFELVDTEAEMSSKTFMMDSHCYDVISFSCNLRDFIEQSSYTKHGFLVIQDKSSCIGPHSVLSIMGEDDDVLHVNVGAGITTAHLVSLTVNSKSIIFAIGMQSEKHHKQIQHALVSLGARSRVKLIGGRMSEFNVNDERLKEVKVAMLTTSCSKSAVISPVNFLVSEGEDLFALRDLALGCTDARKVDELVVQHTSSLKQSLLLPRIQGLVYYTRSLKEEENESVIGAALDYFCTVRPTKTPFRVAPPVLVFDESEVESENPVTGKYLKFIPSKRTNGCFVAVLTREADDPQEAAKGILARAAARGIISGVPDLSEMTGKKKKPKKK